MPRVCIAYTRPRQLFFKYVFFSRSKSDLKTCADSEEAFHCASDWTFEQCGQVVDSKFNYHGCKKIENDKYNFFECLNRNEKAQVLFKKPPVPKKMTEQAINYNTVLVFNETSETIFCGQRNFSLNEFKELKEKYGNENCLLKNGQNVTLSKLWIYLKTDFSFKLSPKLDDL